MGFKSRGNFSSAEEAVGGKVLSPAWFPLEEWLPLPFTSSKVQEKLQYHRLPKRNPSFPGVDPRTMPKGAGLDPGFT